MIGDKLKAEVIFQLVNVKIDQLKSLLEYGLVTVFENDRSVSCIASCNQPVTVERNFTIDGNANTQLLYINRALVSLD